MKKKQYLFNNLLIFLFFLALLCNILAYTMPAVDKTAEQQWQKKLNLGFEKPLTDNWILGGENYSIFTDKSEKKAGLQSLCFMGTKKTDPAITGLAALRLPVDLLRGKRIRLSSFFKTGKNVADLYLWIRADLGIDPVAFKRMPRGPGPKQENGWQRYGLEMEIPDRISDLFIGAGMRGSGKAWIDNLSIELLPARGPDLITLSGKVTDSAGNVVSGALVTVKTFYQESALKIITSDNQGRFQFELLPGFYMINGNSAGHSGGTLPERPYNFDARNLSLKLGTAGFVVQGRVELASGRVPAEMYVAALQMDFFGSQIFYTKPKTDGRFLIEVPKGQPYMILLDSNEYESVPVFIKSDFSGQCLLKAKKPKTSPPEVTAWLRKSVLPISSASPGTGFSDLQPLKTMIGDAKVVGLGETSHGNREFFQMKHRIFEFLVKEMGFTVFALESPWPRTSLLNDYVTNGTGDARKILASGHFIWDTEEVLALIQWIRKYNQDPDNSKKLKFYCLDVRHPEMALQQVFEYLEKVESAHLFLLKQQFPDLGASLISTIYRGSDEQCRQLQNRAADLISHLDQNKKNFSQISGIREWGQARQTARSLQQTIMHTITSKASDYQAIDQRDRFMAENALWILNNEGPGTKIAYWAHNFHINHHQYPGFPCRPMGYYLKAKLGPDYFSLGFEFNRGTFQSRDSTHSRTLFMVKGFSYEPVFGSYASAFSKAGIPIFLLDLGKIPKQGVVHAWFYTSHIFKSIDSLFASKKDVEHQIILPKYFDSLVFFENTNRAKPNPSRLLPGQKL